RPRPGTPQPLDVTARRSGNNRFLFHPGRSARRSDMLITPKFAASVAAPVVLAAAVAGVAVFTRPSLHVSLDVGGGPATPDNIEILPAIRHGGLSLHPILIATVSR